MQTPVKEQQKIFTYYNKILNCINSCINEEQLESCKNLIKNFQNKFSLHVGSRCFLEELEYQIHIKTDSINNK